MKLLRSQTVASEPGLCVDVICMSRTQRIVGDNSHTAYQQCLTLIRWFCWMKRPRLTLHDRIHETALVRVGPKQTVFTPFRDGIWNRRQVSGRMGGPSHTTQKPLGIGPLQYSYSFLLTLPSQSVFCGATFTMHGPSQMVHYYRTCMMRGPSQVVHR